MLCPVSGDNSIEEYAALELFAEQAPQSQELGHAAHLAPGETAAELDSIWFGGDSIFD
jgi:hypothetical protein